MSLNDNFHMTAKPIGATCNMNCTYCYFLSKAQSLKSCTRMDGATLEKFIKDYIAAQKGDVVFFTWHGGEPTLLGIDFFKKAVQLQKQYCPSGKKIENDLQTNGLLLDDTWCAFLKENHFLVGLSVDGDAMGNFYRNDSSGKPVLDRVIAAAALLRKYGVPFNTLTVVNDKNSRCPLETYRFLKEVIGSRHIQFIPLVEVKGHQTTAPTFWKDSVKVEDFSVRPLDWGKFLLAVFNEWYDKDQGEVFVYLFENFLSLWLGRGAQMCVFEETCSHAMALDRDGSVYACDHFCYPEYRYGNINEQPLQEIVSSGKRHDFFKLKSKLPKQCKECRWLSYCNGECPKKRFMATADGEKGLNYLCAGYQFFFENVADKMDILCQKYGR